MSAKDQLRNELLAVAWRYSQESDITTGQTAEAFDEAIEKLGLPRAVKIEDIAARIEMDASQKPSRRQKFLAWIKNKCCLGAPSGAQSVVRNHNHQ